MSNHVHLLLRAPEDNLHVLTGYFNGNVAKNLNRVLGRSHQFWARRYSAEPVLDDSALFGRLMYILTNPQKAHLVRRIEDWMGLSSAPALLENKELRFTFFDRTRWHRNKKPRNVVPYLQVVTIRHAPLPSLRDLTGEARAELLRMHLTQAEQALDATRTAEHRSVLGPDALLETSHIDRPVKPKNTPQPSCHCTDSELRKQYFEALHEVLTLRASCAARVRDGESGVVFPQGTFAPAGVPIRPSPGLLAA